MTTAVNQNESNEGSYERYIIQEIVNPGKFYAVEYGSDQKWGMKPYISQKDVRKFNRLEKAYIGEIVAVKYENELHRGLITDIYNRHMKPSYYVWLMDKGNSTDASADSVFKITNSEIKNEKNKAFEIVLSGICPLSAELIVSSVALDSNMSRNNLESILHKRESNEWSPAAFKFINDLFSKDKNIYMKCANITGMRIVGDVYFKRDCDGKMASLVQTLCDNDFAFLCDSDISTVDICQRIKYLEGIKNRIANAAADVKCGESSGATSQCAREPYEDKFDWGDSWRRWESSASLYSGSTKSFDNSKDQANASKTDSLSPSWILKKMNKLSQSVSCESFTGICRQVDQATPDKPMASPKINILRIIERNARLHDKHQH